MSIGVHARGSRLSGRAPGLSWGVTAPDPLESLKLGPRPVCEQPQEVPPCEQSLHSQEWTTSKVKLGTLPAPGCVPCRGSRDTHRRSAVPRGHCLCRVRTGCFTGHTPRSGRASEHSPAHRPSFRRLWRPGSAPVSCRSHCCPHEGASEQLQDSAPGQGWEGPGVGSGQQRPALKATCVSVTAEAGPSRSGDCPSSQGRRHTQAHRT